MLATGRAARSAAACAAAHERVLHAVQARTGALRFENPDTGHVWLVIVGKSMLLDARAGRTLANECRL